MPLNSTRGGASAKGFGLASGLSPFLEATGGTVTTSGDFKIHSFTTTGTFIVSKAPRNAALGNGVRYLVVGGGGSVNATSNLKGGDSTWNAITSTGGGYGGSSYSGGKPGGSGGGAGGESGGSGVGSGNAGGFSPSEGQNGGVHSGSGASRRPGAGGGASQAGVAQPTGTGGAGTASDITGSSVTYAGGGGGGSHQSPTTTGGAGGGGGGSQSASPIGPGTDGLGGGEGGNSQSGGGGAGGFRTIGTYTTDVSIQTYPVTIGAGAGNGGDGRVILAYKFK
jgi:hypothetical protein